jgi:hypothetical protein
MRRHDTYFPSRLLCNRYAGQTVSYPYLNGHIKLVNFPSVPPPLVPSDLECRSLVARNTGALIRALREAIDAHFDASLYSLFLFDYAAIQVSGLAWGSARSKICEPYCAALVARAVTTFYLTIRGDKRTNPGAKNT